MYKIRKMLNAALRSPRLPSVFSASLPNHHTTAACRKPAPTACLSFSSEPRHPDSDDDPKQDPPSNSKSSSLRDTMSSFGEGYATRSAEEGFGGIYGGNEDAYSDDEEGNSSDAAEFDHSQGSEVKEIEKGRNQNEIAS